MQNATIEELAYFIREAKENNKPMPIFFLGAGASLTAGIPLANEISKNILNTYGDNPRIKKLDVSEQNYANLMNCLSTTQRNTLLKNYIDSAKINVTHLYLAQMLDEGYIDYILTVNFDNIMLKALSLYNIFPPTYDMAILKDHTTSKPHEKSVIYLHGQHHGLWLLNTPEEMKKVDKTIPPILHSIKDARPWVFIGYSGNDPIFNHIKELGRFDNELYWVAYKNNDPDLHVKEFLNQKLKGAYVIKGYDSDSFMLQLNNELKLSQPDIINKPFSSLKQTINNIVDIDNTEHYIGVKKRLDRTKVNIDNAIETYEKNHEVDENAKLKEKITEIIISNNFDNIIISDIKNEVEIKNDPSLNSTLADLYLNWGNSLSNLADVKIKNKDNKDNKEREDLLLQAINKYESIIEITPNNSIALYNLGTSLTKLSQHNTGNKKEELLLLAISKYESTIKIDPNFSKAYTNWGSSLSSLSENKKETEKEELLLLSISKCELSIGIDPNQSRAYSNWAHSLSSLSTTKKDKEKKDLLLQAINLYEKSIENGGSSYNLSCIYSLLKNKEKALSQLRVCLELKPEYSNFVLQDIDWAYYLDDKDLLKLLDEFKI